MIDCILTTNNFLETLKTLKIRGYIEASEDFDILNSAQWIDTYNGTVVYETPPCDHFKLTEEDEIKNFHNVSFPVSYINEGRVEVVSRMFEVLSGVIGTNIEKTILGRIAFEDIKEEDIKNTRFFMNNTIMAPSKTMNNMMDTYNKFSGLFSTFVRPRISYLLEDNQFITIEKEAPVYVVMQDMLWAEQEMDTIKIFGSFDIRMKVDGYKGYTLK